MQRKRADVLFRLYPDIKECYDRYLELVQIYNLKIDHRPTLMTKLAKWYDRVYNLRWYFRTNEHIAKAEKHL